MITGISDVLDSFYPVNLDEMSGFHLMNRTDIKYILPSVTLREILTRMNGKYKVLEINSSRVFSYNTTYLDTDDYLFFREHVRGKPERNKVRFRKYEITGTTYLEVKKRTFKDRTIKWRIPHIPLAGNEYDTSADEFIRSHIRQRPLILKCALVNRFKRITLIGLKANERITIDYDLTYSLPGREEITLPALAVIELKRDRLKSESEVKSILKNMSFRPTGFSKYCIGTALLNEKSKNNILKEKLLMIKKIENGNR